MNVLSALVGHGYVDLLVDFFIPFNWLTSIFMLIPKIKPCLLHGRVILPVPEDTVMISPAFFAPSFSFVTLKATPHTPASQTQGLAEGPEIWLELWYEAGSLGLLFSYFGPREDIFLPCLCFTLGLSTYAPLFSVGLWELAQGKGLCMGELVAHGFYAQVCCVSFPGFRFPFVSRFQISMGQRWKTASSSPMREEEQKMNLLDSLRSWSHGNPAGEQSMDYR